MPRNELKDYKGLLQAGIWIVGSIGTFLLFNYKYPAFVRGAIALTAAALLCGFSVYVVLSKQSSPIIGGETHSKFPRGRKWGFVGIGLSLTAIGILLATPGIRASLFPRVSPKIESFQIARDQYTYRIEAIIDNPYGRDLLINRVELNSISTAVNVACTPGISADYQLAKNVTATIIDKETTELAMTVSPSVGALQGFDIPAKGRMRSFCRTEMIEIEFAITVELKRNRRSAFYIGLPQEFVVAQDNSRNHSRYADARLTVGEHTGPILVLFPFPDRYDKVVPMSGQFQNLSAFNLPDGVTNKNSRYAVIHLSLSTTSGERIFGGILLF